MNSIEKFNLLPNFVLGGGSKKKTVYISPIGSSGIATASKNHIYSLIKSGKSVQWLQYDISGVSPCPENTAFDKFISKSKKIVFGPIENVIVHSLPTVWDELIFNSGIDVPNVEKIVGRTVWEFEKLLPEWVDVINKSKVTHVSVPTKWNRDIFIKNGVLKPIEVDPHPFVNVADINYTLEHLLKKGIVVFNGDLKYLNIHECYKFYCIEEFSSRKNLSESIHAFCRAFKSHENVVFLIKTFRKNYDIENVIECARLINELASQYENHAPIIYLKDQFDYNEIHSLHHHGDCYFHLYHSEGFGLGIHDAINHKKEVLVTGVSGPTEYLDVKENSLVKYTTGPVNKKIFNDQFLDESYEWAFPEIDDAILKLRAKYSNGMQSEKYCVPNFTIHNNHIPLERQNPNAKIIPMEYGIKNFHFNSSIFSFKNEKYLLTRHCKLDDDNIPDNRLNLFKLDSKYGMMEIPLKINDEIENEQYEDPRVFVHDDKIYIGCANYQKHVSEKIHQKLIVLDESFVHVKNIHPIYDGNAKNCLENTKHQKNWTYFIHDGKILCVYRMHPHTVVEFDMNTGEIISEYKTHCDILKQWKFGAPRMGSNPVLKDGVFHNFFHSSIPWKNPKRQYFMGHYTFEAKPPFKILEISKQPILWGNESDQRILPNSNPIVVFPCGAIYENGNFYVSFGFNDEKTGIIKI
jgi:predicted GH43/DUF377 family glycosyl hydrolase